MFDNTGDGPADTSDPTPADVGPALPGLAGRLLAGLDPASAAAVRAAVSHEQVPVDEDVSLPAWAGLPGSLALAIAVAELDPADLDEPARVELIAAYERLAGWV
ncbi:MAG TPA: hypothetical protein VLC50_01180, partial [Actinomycetes bacterium]|nr:hypothetical protein [Actinomycetes bacterium]